MKYQQRRKEDLTAQERVNAYRYLESKLQYENWLYYIQHYHDINEDPEKLFKELRSQPSKLEKKDELSNSITIRRD